VKNVLLIQAFIPHYRVSFFERLHEALRQENIDLRVAYGRPSRIDRTGYDSVSCNLPFGVRARSFWLFNARVLLQPVLREIARADLVIVEQANKHLVNHLLLMLSCLGIKKVAFWGHGWNRQRRNPNGLSEKVKAQLVRFPDWWFAYTDSTARYLKSKGVRAHVITTVQNSVDVRSFQNQLSEITDQDIGKARSDLGMQPGSTAGLFCGRLYRDKHLRFLMHASREIRARIPDFHLIIIGDGPDKKTVEMLAEGMGWVHAVGARRGREKALYFRLAQVFLNPGLVGLAILDAFACGLPVVTTDISIHSPEIDYLENGRNGVMCPPALSDYADAVAGVLADRSLYDRLRAGALASADRYSLDTMVENFTGGVVQCLGQGTERTGPGRARSG
jgi:glycosyltransferase involved in cell wall biosynthesis